MHITDDDQTGTIIGSVRSTHTNVPLVGSVVIDERLRLALDSEGTFRASLPARPEAYTVQTDVIGHINQRASLYVRAGATEEQHFTLATDAPHLEILSEGGHVVLQHTRSPAPLTSTLQVGDVAAHHLQIRNAGSQPLSYTASVPAESFGVWRSDETSGPAHAWADMPIDATTALSLTDNGSAGPLPLGFDFPFYGTTFDKIYVGANGILSFEPLPLSRALPPGCLPAAEALSSAIAPLRTDLDPSQGGSVRWANTIEGFVISFENVPLASDEPDTAPTYTFQVVLTPDGSIRFHYDKLGELPANTSIGIQRNRSTTQEIGCGGTAAIASNLTLELRPQPDTQSWLRLSGSTRSSALPPGSTDALAIEVGRVFAQEPRSYRGHIVLTSNDPFRPSIRLPIIVTSEPAQHVTWMPMFRYNP
jgi:hypothetical protein